MAPAAVAVTATEDALLMALLHAAKFPSCAVGGALLGPAAATATATTAITAAIPLFHHPTAAMAACVEAGLAQVEALAASRGLALVGYYHAPVHYPAPGPRAAAAGADEAAQQQQQRDDADAADADARRALPPPAKRIAERIAERRPPGSSPAVVLALNNPRLARFSGVIGGGAGAAAGSAVVVGGDPPCPFDVYVGPGWQRLPGPAAGGGEAGGGAGGDEQGASPSPSPLQLAPSSSSASWQGLQRRWLNARAARLHRSLADFDEHVDDVSRDYTNPDLLGEATRTLVR